VPRYPIANERKLFRLAEQAQRQLEKGGKFEDLNQISRPTELIRSYNSLYSQARIDALDALDNTREMSNAEDLKSKLLFSVVVVCRNKYFEKKLKIFLLIIACFSSCTKSSKRNTK
jgi:hypothetical protein